MDESQLASFSNQRLQWPSHKQCVTKSKIADQYQKERSERGVVVNDNEDLAGSDEVTTLDVNDDEGRNPEPTLDSDREESSRLDRDLELDIDFPNPAINEIESQFNPEEGMEWTFKEKRKEKETSTAKPQEEERTTTEKSIVQTQFGVPFHLQLPPLPSLRSLNSVWTILDNLNDVIYDCERQFFVSFHPTSIIPMF